MTYGLIIVLYNDKKKPLAQTRGLLAMNFFTG
ncbi:hypothetical protein T256_02700 [Pediococcus pentosaceus SL4]|nr:hypothetical protein T256_02700 [Pediococcus pentosaceus SL4]